MAKQVRRRKLNLKKFFRFLIILLCLVFLIIFTSKIPIKNIVIKGNSYVTDEEIMEKCSLEDYPSFIRTTKSKIKKCTESIPLIKSVKVSKKLNSKLVIDVTEYKVLFKIRSTDEYVLDENVRLSDLSVYAPILINYVQEDVLNKLISKFELLDKDIINKISEIEYSPNNYDKERFILYMNDENTVYITLTKAKNLNNYNKIKEQLGTNKGILYLDSGNYFEIKE